MMGISPGRKAHGQKITVRGYRLRLLANLIKLRRRQLYEIVDGRQLFGGEVATHSVPQLLRQLQPLLLAHFLTPRDPPYGQVNINLPASLPSKPRPVFESLPLFSPTGLKGRGPTKQV